MSVPRLPPDLRETAKRWLDASPTNAPRRPRDLFNDLRSLTRCARLAERGALERVRFGRYKLSDWAIADILNDPPPPPSTPPSGDAA